jgi:hypothetical protein
MMQHSADEDIRQNGENDARERTRPFASVHVGLGPLSPKMPDNTIECPAKPQVSECRNSMGAQPLQQLLPPSGIDAAREPNAAPSNEINADATAAQAQWRP